jgi:hypothetical protein
MEAVTNTTVMMHHLNLTEVCMMILPWRRKNLQTKRVCSAR